MPLSTEDGESIPRVEKNPSMQACFSHADLTLLSCGGLTTFEAKMLTISLFFLLPCPHGRHSIASPNRDIRNGLDVAGERS